MAKSGLQVFANQEPLEHIPFYMPGGEKIEDTPQRWAWSTDDRDEYDEGTAVEHPQATTRPVALQVVNKSPDGRIDDSTQLRRRIGLQRDQDQQDCQRPEFGEVVGFLYRFIPQISGLQIISSGGTSMISAIMSIESPTPDRLPVFQKPQSWRNIRCPEFKDPIQVQVKVVLGNPAYANAMWYIEKRCLEKDGSTLGDITDIFHAICARTQLRHWLLAVDRQGRWFGVFVRLLMMSGLVIFALLLLFLANGCLLALR